MLKEPAACSKAWGRSAKREKRLYKRTEMKLSDLYHQKERGGRKKRKEGWRGREEAVLMHEWLKAIVPENATGTRDVLKTFSVSNPATLVTLAAGAGGESAARCDDSSCCADVDLSLLSLVALSAGMSVFFFF